MAMEFVRYKKTVFAKPNLKFLPSQQLSTLFWSPQEDIMFTPDGENIVGIPKLPHLNGMDDIPPLPVKSVSKIGKELDLSFSNDKRAALTHSL